MKYPFHIGCSCKSRGYFSGLPNGKSHRSWKEETELPEKAGEDEFLVYFKGEESEKVQTNRVRRWTM